MTKSDSSQVTDLARSERGVVPIDLIREALIQKPKPPQGGLTRLRLFQLLDRGLEEPANLVCAPAGFGKSVLVSQWAETISRPVCWVSGDERLNDPHSFVLHLTAAIRRALPEAVPVTFQMANSVELPDLAAVITELSNELANLAESIVIVVDDFQLLTAPQCQQIISELARHPISTVHLVLITRHEPPASIGSLRAKGYLNELGMADLAFTAEELKAFTRGELAADLSPDQLEEIYRTTEGWPSGARLATQAIRLAPNGETTQGASLLDQAAQEYLFAEVLTRVPPDVQLHLHAVAPFERFNADLCDAVAAVATSNPPLMTGADFIDWTWRNNLFIVKLGGTGDWYRFHHVFARFLANRWKLPTDKPAYREPEIRHAAADVFTGHGMIQEAIDQLSLIDDGPGIAKLATELGSELLEQEQWLQLSQLLSTIPANVLDGDPTLLLLRAWVVGDIQSRHTEMTQLLGRAEELLDQRPPDEASEASMRGQITALRSAYESFIFGDFEDALAGSATARRLLADSAGRHVTFAYVVEALALAGLGRSLEAHRLVKTVVEDERFAETPFHPMAWALPYLGWLEGDLTSQDRHATQLLAIGERHAMPDSIASAHYFLGISAYERNELDEAEQHLSEVIQLRFATQAINVVHAYIATSLLALARGQRDRADTVASEMMKYVLDTHSAFLLPVAEAFLAQLDLRQGRHSQALRWAWRADPDFSRHRYMFFSVSPTAVQVLLSNESDIQQGRLLLVQYLELAKARRHHPDTLLLLGLQAIDLASVDEPHALEILATAVRMSQESGMIRRIADLGPVLVPLLHRLQVTDEDLIHVKAILNAIEPAARKEPTTAAGASLPRPAGELALTDRELEVLNMLAARYSNKEIAKELVLAPATVKKHTIAIYDKLNVHGRRDAVAKAQTLGYLVG